MSVPAIPAEGAAFGHPVQTTVDSEAARYYLEQHMRGQRSNAELSAAIDELQRRFADGVPSRSQLADIARVHSVDFATLFFVRQLQQDDCNRQINLEFRRVLAAGPAPFNHTDPFMVLFVPGWDYAENGAATGADFAQPRRLMTALGVKNHLVPLPPTGSVEENARVLVQSLEQFARSGERILLAGASSAGPAIHLALAELTSPETRRAVSAWLNLGGILQGSPLVDFMQELPQRWLFQAVAWYNGWSTDAIDSMSARQGRRRFERLALDANLLVVNYLGVPLSGQLSQYSRDKYPLLKEYGPNDGLTLLTDAIAPNSLTIVALGSDHFLAEDPAIDAKTVALLRLMLKYLDRDASAGKQACTGR